MRIIYLPLLMALTGCADVPVLDNRISDAARAAPYPQLIDVTPLLAQASAAPPSNAALVGDINARIARLNSRANALRGPIITAPTRARMLRGVNSAALL